MLELLVQGSHGSQLQDDGQRVDADPDQGNDVRMLQVDQDVQLLPATDSKGRIFFTTRKKIS
jgi:hypothetical protein